MTDRRDFSDQDLSCYLDGEADPGLAAALTTALATDTGLQARLDALRAALEPFTQALEAALKLAPDMATLPQSQPRAANSNWKVGLAGVAIGAIAALGLTWARAPDTPKYDWIEDVALYQSLYVAETLALIDTAPEENKALLAQVSRALGFDLTNLPQVAGLTLKHTQQLGYNGKPLAQLIFANTAGNPVALCVTRTNAADTANIRFQIVQGLRAYTWVENGYGILLIGPPDDTTLENTAALYRLALKNAAI